MRYILFRGKRIDNSKWVEGDLYHDWSAQQTCPAIQICTGLSRCFVIPESIGQYTGLTDKNGKKIFEGDICKGYNFLHENRTIYEVGFDDGQFALCDESGTSWHHSHIDNIEVIGNIHDNRKLLKWGDNDYDRNI